MLCHRLGLLPIYVNPTHFIFPPPKDSQNDKENDVSEEPMGDPKENIIFELNVSFIFDNNQDYALHYNNDLNLLNIEFNVLSFLELLQSKLFFPLRLIFVGKM